MVVQTLAESGHELQSSLSDFFSRCVQLVAYLISHS